MSALCRDSFRPEDEEYQLLKKLVELRNGDAGSRQNFCWILEEINAGIDAAIVRSHEQWVWLYYRITVSTWGQAAKAIPLHILPITDTLKQDFSIGGWWWLYKQDVLGSAIRLRLVVPRESARNINRYFTDAISEYGYQLNTLAYEPEVRLFGGIAGIQVAHDYFCMDSYFLSHWAALNMSDQETILPAGLSIAIVMRLLRTVGLDSFETWDFAESLAAARKAGRPQDHELRPYRIMMAAILPSLENVFSLNYGEQNDLLAAYIGQVDVFGDRIRRLYFEGNLECGLREILVPLVLFHWNRVGFGQRAQRNLSMTLAEAYRTIIGRSGPTSSLVSV